MDISNSKDNAALSISHYAKFLKYKNKVLIITGSVSYHGDNYYTYIPFGNICCMSCHIPETHIQS